MAKFYPDLDAIEQKLQRKRDITILEKLQVYQSLNRDLRRALTVHQFVAFSYLVDRSIGFGKNWFRASHGNILEGTVEYSGIGLAERTYFRVMAELEGIGLIERRRRRDCVDIIVHVDWLEDVEEPVQVDNVVQFR